MPLTVPEALDDLPEAVALFNAVKGSVEALPATADRKPSDYMKLAATVLTAAAPLADKVEAQVKS